MTVVRSESFFPLLPSDAVFVVGGSAFVGSAFGSSFLTVSVWTDGAVVFTADGNGSANELRMFVTAVGGSAFFGSAFDSSVLTVNVWTDGAVVTADGNGSANELRMFVTAVFTADTTGALAVLMT